MIISRFSTDLIHFIIVAEISALNEAEAQSGHKEQSERGLMFPFHDRFRQPHVTERLDRTIRPGRYRPRSIPRPLLHSAGEHIERENPGEGDALPPDEDRIHSSAHR